MKPVLGKHMERGTCGVNRVHDLPLQGLEGCRHTGSLGPPHLHVFLRLYQWRSWISRMQIAGPPPRPYPSSLEERGTRNRLRPGLPVAIRLTTRPTQAGSGFASVGFTAGLTVKQKNPLGVVSATQYRYWTYGEYRWHSLNDLISSVLTY